MSAYTNSTSTDSYIQLVNNNYVGAILEALEAPWGDWLYVLLAAGPYIGFWIAHGSHHIATMWLTVVLVAYGGFLTSGLVPAWVFYLLTVAWVMSVLARLLSPIWSN